MTFEVRGGDFSYGRGGRADGSHPDVLNDVNFTVSQGDVLAILGPNGAGKTTLLRCIMGFLHWREGESLLDGESIRAMSPAKLFRRVAYVPQAKAAPGGLTVIETTLLGRNSRISAFRQPDARDIAVAERALNRLGISHLRDRPCAELSGGELQMALIARALAAEPELLILDEPESNLDFRNQLIVLDTISSLAAQGIACIFNTHYPTHALQRANKALLLSRDGGAKFGNVNEIVTEENIERAFGVRAVIGEIETPHSILRDVLPISLSRDGDWTELSCGAEPQDNIEGEACMETRIAIMGIIVEDRNSAEGINELLHQYGEWVIGRMGMPYPKKQVSVICVVLDAPQDVISALSGRLGMLPGVSIKTTYSKK